MSDTILLHQHRARATGLLARAIEIIARWQRRARTRAELARLDEHALHDIGVTRAQAEYELGKPFWRP
jgi:uncharacterized protein YjiS (DUF1127 family)